MLENSTDDRNDEFLPPDSPLFPDDYRTLSEERRRVTPDVEINNEFQRPHFPFPLNLETRLPRIDNEIQRPPTTNNNERMQPADRLIEILRSKSPFPVNERIGPTIRIIEIHIPNFSFPTPTSTANERTRSTDSIIEFLRPYSPYPMNGRFERTERILEFQIPNQYFPTNRRINLTGRIPARTNESSSSTTTINNELHSSPTNDSVVSVLPDEESDNDIHIPNGSCPANELMERIQFHFPNTKFPTDESEEINDEHPNMITPGPPCYSSMFPTDYQYVVPCGDGQNDNLLSYEDLNHHGTLL